MDRIGPEDGGNGSRIDGRVVGMVQRGLAVRIDEIVQAGDVFLVRYNCPFCGLKKFQPYVDMECRECNVELMDIPCVLPRAVTRLLVGSKRKKRTRFGKRLIAQMLEQQAGLCAYCSSELFESFEIEHIIPISVGGTNNITNICISCHACNAAAGSNVFRTFYLKRDFILMKRFRKCPS